MASLAPVQPRHVGQRPARAAQSGEHGFTPLEQSIIRLAFVDRPWTARNQGPLRRLWNGLIGRGNPRLTAPRLEALRKMAVMARHFGRSVPDDVVRDFLSAGFTTEHFEQLLSNLQTLASPREQRRRS